MIQHINPKRSTRRKGFKILFALLLGITCTKTGAFANGFAVFNQAARAAGMANAFVARASDPSAVWYNPAGLTQFKGLQIYAGGLLQNIGARRYYSAYRDDILTADGISNILPSFFITYRLSDRVGAGLGLYSPFNYDIEWPQTREMEHVVYILNRLEIRSWTLSPSIAVQLSDNFSLGAGINLNYFTCHAAYHYRFDTQSIVAMLTNGEVRDCPDTVIDLSRFKTNSIGFTAGVRWEPAPFLSIGAVYRRGSHLSFDSGIVNAWEPEIQTAYASLKLAEMFPDSLLQSAVVELSTVDRFSAGVAFDIGDSLDVELDFTWVLWSQMEHFNIDYALETMVRIPFWNAMFDIEAPTHFKDTMSIQLGGEYTLSQSLDLRLGAFYHGSPVEIPYLTPAFPLADKIGFSAGLGFHINRFRVDIAYLYNSLSELEASNSLFSRWGDTSQTYLSRKDHSLMIGTGVVF